jgi:hypothetical protein
MYSETSKPNSNNVQIIQFSLYIELLADSSKYLTLCIFSCISESSKEELEAACNDKITDFEPRVMARVAGIKETKESKSCIYIRKLI